MKPQEIVSNVVFSTPCTFHVYEKQGNVTKREPEAAGAGCPWGGDWDTRREIISEPGTLDPFEHFVFRAFKCIFHLKNKCPKMSRNKRGETAEIYSDGPL